MAKPTTHYRTCNLCEAMCGLEITLDKGKVISIKGDKNDPLSQGHICPKAVALQDLHDDPDRLRYPMLKTPQGWERISWDNAFNEAVSRLKNIQAKHGNNAVATYVGNPTIHNLGSMLTVMPFLLALNTENRYSATSVDQLSHMLANLKMFGNQTLFPVPDIDRTDYFLCLGANPMASNGSIMVAPGFKKRIKALQERGGKCVVVDPRRTETAEIADEHLFIKPGTDALFLMAIIHTLFRQDLVSLGDAQSYVEGLNVLRNMVAGFTPEKVARQTGITAKHIRRIAKEFAKAPRAVCYGRMGTSTQAYGGLSTWLIYVINIITGNFDREGGAMFSQPAVDIAGLGILAGENGTYNTRKSRVRKLPEFGGEYPAATLADEILTGGEGQIRALVTCAGNPVLSLPNGRKMETALKNLDFMVCIDFYLNETTQHADIILPPTGPLEHSHYDLALHTVAVRNTAKYSPKLFNPAPDTRHDWEILLELTRRLESRSPISWATSEAKYQILKRLGADGILDLLLRTGAYGTQLHYFKDLQERLVDLLYDRLSPRSIARLALDLSPYSHRTQNRDHELSLALLKKHPHGIDLGPLKKTMPERLATKNKTINLVPKLYMKDVSRLQQELESNSKASQETFILIGRRHIRSNNSWLHNSQRLIKGKNRCTAQMNPADAKLLNINEGDPVTLSSRVGEITLPVELTETIMPGVISVPHGWGHHRDGSRLQIAKTRAGVSINDIMDDSQTDPLTGTAVLNGQQVTVSKTRQSPNVVRLNDARLAAVTPDE